MNDDDAILFMFIAIVVFVGGMMVGNFFTNFAIPTAKIWEANRSYDHLLIADDVVCNPMNDINATYYRLNILRYNNTEYVLTREKVNNTEIRKIVICGDGK
jgi:hypothetical protein